jgi:membrane associated rhomboid family serine protease
LIPLSDADIRRRTSPVINILFIGLNTLVFLYEVLVGGLGIFGGGGNPGIVTFFHTWGFIPAELTQGEPFTQLRLGFNFFADIETPVPTWATIFSSMFIHGGLLHFGGNMLFLWVFGHNLEDRIGHIMYLLFYLITGVAATLTHWVIDPQSQTPLVGASGAISGVLGGYMLLYPYNRIRVLVILFIFITALQVPAMYLLGFWFLLQLLEGFGSLGVSNQVSVAFFAHIGGFLAGLAIIAAYKILTGQGIWPRRRHFPSSGGTKYWRGRPLD